jgi:hypothetical protein
MKSIKLTALVLSCFGLAHSAFALPYNLQTASAAIVANANIVSTFYEVSGSGVETPGTSAINLFSATTGGDANNGYWVNISFGLNPQPYLDSAFLKAGNGYLLWDSADLAGFNAGTYDSIVLWNNSIEGIRNTNGKYKGTSHAGLFAGTKPVVTVHNVPDASSTVTLLGLSMIGLFVVGRRRASK